ncbi:MAG: phosphotyrosine protein phosphatase [Leptospiraceae bacterium]|nr:phosphotyrosine protein phosphatase [Leptospiraceae bacterium]MBK7053527.1 phosphotyrosine protein phosphatase [Leptospiraceae bacterium]MBK9500347.1 phosphotyrosine protein phosphatase [Leptospiraceae bacterium]MBL0265546.1 phosphotyrosine protein phosphatase [Leptospiraceae bacterium]MBP9162960.1 phosphotyrosine protein phosphatase [Leptospiraceae bacterium]
MHPKLKVLFLCSQNKKRSPTAEEIYGVFDSLEVRSAGLNKGAVYLLEPEDIQWADIIFVMEKKHFENLHRKYEDFTKNKKVINLSIPDKFAFMDETLIRVLRQKVDKYVL